MESLGAPVSPAERTITASYASDPPTGPTVIPALRRLLADKYALSAHNVNAIASFLNKVEQLQAAKRGHNGFEREYGEICWSIDKAPWYANALTPQTKLTKAKNRYSDVLPFEKTRVHLANPQQTPAGDYINANFVDEDYIACCAPIPSAMVDFWRMVWQYDVHVVLMLTNFVESERRKADIYWDARGKAVDFDGVLVQLVSEQDHPASSGFRIRSFNVWTTDAVTGQPSAVRAVQHIQLTIWPDHGVLRDFRVIAPMLELVHSFQDQASQTHGVRAKVIVHCSAGIGRSGTFIAIDIILRSIYRVLSEPNAEAGALSRALDVQHVVHRIRSQRPGMVQTPDQYAMVYKYLAAVLSDTQPW